MLLLNHVPEEEQAEKGPELARKLRYVMVRKVSLDWYSIPDRPDGEEDDSPNPKKSAAGPRRSILLDRIDLSGRDVEVRIERVKAGDASPVWMLGPSVTRHIGELYDRYGPGLLDKKIPDWARVRILGRVPLWEWVALLLLLGFGALVGWLVQKAVAGSFSRSKRGWVRALGSRVRAPFAVFVTLIVFLGLTRALLSLSGPVLKYLNPIGTVLLIGSVTWIGMRLVSLASHRLGKRFEARLEEDGGNVEIRRRLTYVSVARRILVFAAFLAGLGVVLSRFQLFEPLGVTLLASAGVAGVILGVAAQSVLGNLIAGIQIAVTQPVQIGDYVIFEGHYGTVAEITYTFLVIRRWDERRIVVPLRYFLDRPIQNLSMKDEHLVRAVVLPLDYRAPVDRIREKLREILESDGDWDGEEAKVQVIECEDETIVLRATCGAADPPTAWNLHCRLREELVGWLQQLDGGRYLPRRRLEIDADERERPDAEPE